MGNLIPIVNKNNVRLLDIQSLTIIWALLYWLHKKWSKFITWWKWACINDWLV